MYQPQHDAATSGAFVQRMKPPSVLGGKPEVELVFNPISLLSDQLAVSALLGVMQNVPGIHPVEASKKVWEYVDAILAERDERHREVASRPVPENTSGSTN